MAYLSASACTGPRGSAGEETAPEPEVRTTTAVTAGAPTTLPPEAKAVVATHTHEWPPPDLLAMTLQDAAPVLGAVKGVADYKDDRGRWRRITWFKHYGVEIDAENRIDTVWSSDMKWKLVRTGK